MGKDRQNVRREGGLMDRHSINANLYRKLALDPVKDFAPITQASIVPLVINEHKYLFLLSFFNQRLIRA
jgi:hypothetical protein